MAMLRVHGSHVRYLHEFIGINSRLDALQAAILQIKLKYLDRWAEGRRRNAARYEQLFTDAGAPLFPASQRELSMRCTCPDVAVPCKHIAATFYLLAERFDDDPFELLLWRGRSAEGTGAHRAN